MLLKGTNIDITPFEAIPDGAGIPDDLKGKPADALRVPVAYLGISNPRYFNRAFFARFSKVLRLGPQGEMAVREAAGNKHLVTSSSEDTILNTKHHPTRAGLDRYRWFTDPDENVEYGFLIES